MLNNFLFNCFKISQYSGEISNKKKTKKKLNYLKTLIKTFSHNKSKQTFPNKTKHTNQITPNSIYQPFIANIIVTPSEGCTTTTASPTTTTSPTNIMRSAVKPVPRTKRRPSVTFKLPSDNNREPNNRPTDILETTAPSLSLSAATEELKEHNTQPGDNVNIDNNGDGTGSDNGGSVMAKSGAAAATAAIETGAATASLMTQPEDMNSFVMEIDNVSVKPFVAKQSAHVPEAPAFIDVAHRQFSNPISYLGGPLLKPRNRYSIESILSLD